jgi:hypothetical protein
MMMQQRPTQTHRWFSFILTLLLTVTSPAQTPTPAKPIYPATTDHAPPAWFIDVASQAGIAVRNVNGSVDHKRQWARNERQDHARRNPAHQPLIS